MQLRPATAEERNGWDEPDVVAITRAGTAEPIGAIGFTIEAGTLTVRRMEVAPALRGRGYGSEAVRLLESEAVRGHGVTRFEAPAPQSLGLALYFWLRLGYRPASADGPEWRPLTGGDIISMVREA
ncbi:MAG: GNAT family N-acetyltransferase [Dehalococcoidia bacterium]|nr:GNAT family N-acetyltransferase [Dehalococcoidia bacterium]